MMKYHADEKAKLRDRAKAVANAVAGLPDEPIFRMTKHGEVRMDSVEHKVDPAGIDYIEVRAPGAPDPHFRIYAPPLLAEDPHGDVDLDGKKYRHDPILALAQVLARHGAAKKRGRRLR